MSLGLGGNLENALVYDDTKCLSVPRFPDELVRHKILDVLGIYPLSAHGKGISLQLNQDIPIIRS